MFEVTREWIFENTTELGAWTWAQFRALGVPVPPQGGWIERLVGTFISEEQKKAFEEGRTHYSKSKKAAKLRAQKLRRMNEWKSSGGPEVRNMQEQFIALMSREE